jgi:hypothetical protein
VPLSKFFRDLSCNDKLLLFVGSFAAVSAGALLPSISLIMSRVAQQFNNSNNGQTDPNMIQNMTMISAAVGMISLGIFGFSYVFYAFWQHLAENITNNLRKKYLAALLH